MKREGDHIEVQKCSLALEDAEAVYNEQSYRVGILFKGRNDAYLMLALGLTRGDIIGKFMMENNFDYYINLDGGISSSFYADGKYTSENLSPFRKIHEAFYIKQKDDTEYNLTMNTNRSDVAYAKATKSLTRAEEPTEINKAKAGDLITVYYDFYRGSIPFEGWGSNCEHLILDKNNYIQFTMPPQDLNISAIFTVPPEEDFEVIFKVEPSGGGNPTITPAKPTSGSKPTIKANPNPGYKFVKWQIEQGEMQENENEETVIVLRDYYDYVAIWAYYEELPTSTYSIFVTANPSEGGNPQSNVSSASFGNLVTLTANPNTNYQFTGWTVISGDVVVYDSSFIMPDKDVEIRANYQYVSPYVNVSIAAMPTNGGDPEVVPARAMPGALIHINANPRTNYKFLYWTFSDNRPRLYNPNSTFTLETIDITVTANYEYIPPMYDVTIYAVPSNGGNPKATPSSAAQGTPINLQANPNKNYYFKKWTFSDNISDSLLATTIMPMPPKNITATAHYEYSAPEPLTITGYGIYVNKLGLNIRQSATANSTLITTVPVWKELKIRYFLSGFQSDGYQWAATEYNGNVGFSQIDTNGYYTVLLTDTSVINPVTGACIIPKSLYIMSSSKGAYIRSSIVSGSILVTVPGNTKMLVEQLIPNFQSDNFQWAKVSYNGKIGYVQVDVKSWHYFVI